MVTPEERRRKGLARRHYLDGVRASRKREYVEAAAFYERALEFNPDHAHAMVDLGGMIFINAEPSGEGRAQLERARRLLLRGVELNYTLEVARVYEAIICCKLDLFTEAEVSFCKALVKNEDKCMVHTAYAYNVLWELGRYGEAEAHFEAALGFDAEDPLTLRRYGKMLAEHGRDEEAAKLFERALEEDPDDEFFQRAYEQFTVQLKDPERDPKACLRTAVAEDCNYTRGIALLKAMGESS